MRGALMDRRHFLKAAGAVYLAGLTAAQAATLTATDAVYASAFRAQDGSFDAALLSEDGRIVARVALPGRAHGLAASANKVAAFARRPGTFIFIFDRQQQVAPVVVNAPAGRHFYGHGHFSPDGKLLYASENDFDNNRGMIGLYDATDGFRRIGEFSAHGIGTHDMNVSDDGSLLIIANGGIETNPDFGRTKLNLDHMQPSLVLADAKTGELIEKHELPEAMRQLSTRHIDLDARGRIWFACQYEGPRRDLPPLVGHFRRGEALHWLDLPPDITRGLANYVGAIAVNRHEGLVGVTSPNGGLSVTLDADSGKVLKTASLSEAAGIAPAAHGFATSSYDGRFLDRSEAVNWDQHIIRIG
ncbi:DUF1513 domain-containing protein [Agrobacterium vitis]|uniref:DUF1513 domain-containing protein n=1 Tax=Agrobacterium vitis TaxID=373 RepID=UPI0012E98635|nr:DUF1513 domain-containing protein [Agrobacterium vitis]MVA62695.1 DUF1513 domain-containing protein [Agrobacterium vitis]